MTIALRWENYWQIFKYSVTIKTHINVLLICIFYEVV